LAKKVIYIVIGPHEHAQYFLQLQALVEKFSLQGSVKFLGYQPDNILFAYMANADVFVNLRFPAMEGASWSLIEQLYCGKPIIVSDTGFYSELPDDCVMKIHMDREESELFDALKELVFKDKMREEIGTRGKQFAIKNFNVQKYCKAFFDFLNEVKNWSPVLGLVDKVAVELALMGISQDSEVVDKVAGQIYQMIGGNKQSL
jgi:glycosyltransferase involved in cell wall biosynthesis